MITEIEKKLRKMTKSEIFQICRKMKCPTGTKREMIKNLLRPLGKKYKMKYKMDKIPSDVKQLMSEYYTDSDLGALRATSKSQKDLQPILDKRGIQRFNKVKKWNNIFMEDGIQGIERELKENKFKDIKDLHDLLLKNEIYVGNENSFESFVKDYANMLRRNLNDINYTVIEEFLKNQSLHEAVKEYLKDKRTATEKYGDISGWDVSNVTDMSAMFAEAFSFNGDLSKWDVSNVKNMHAMFFAAESFNGDLSKWDVSNVRNMSSMFSYSSFNGDLSKWNVSNVRNMYQMFGDTSFNGDLSNWDVSNVEDMENMFLDARYNRDLSKWNVSNVRNMRQMFHIAESFNGDLSKWDVSNVTNMENMFHMAKSFNGDLSNWNVSNVRDMRQMFKEAESFNGDLSKWNVSNVRNMESMFNGAEKFDKKNAPWFFK